MPDEYPRKDGATSFLGVCGERHITRLAPLLDVVKGPIEAGSSPSHIPSEDTTGNHPNHRFRATPSIPTYFRMKTTQELLCDGVYKGL